MELLVCLDIVLIADFRFSLALLFCIIFKYLLFKDIFPFSLEIVFIFKLNCRRVLLLSHLNDSFLNISVLYA